MKAWSLSQPGANFGMFVSIVVVYDQVEAGNVRDCFLDLAKKSLDSLDFDGTVRTVSSLGRLRRQG